MADIRAAITRALLAGSSPLGGKPGGPWEGGIRAYHSSPHDFDKFDWSKLRTGEGANAYGAGFYFAENPAVSGQGGQYWKQFVDRFPKEETDAADLLARYRFDRDKAILHAEQIAKDVPSPRNVQALEHLRSDNPVGPRTYEVNINARPELLLDWDKPLAQMSPEVQARLKDAWLAHPDAHSRQTGEQIYQNAQITHHQPGRGHEDAVIASQKLAEAGIPGIRYLDQGSRAPVHPDRIEAAKVSLDLAKQRGDQAGLTYWQERLADFAKPPSYNYVVTDPSKLDIMARYGVVGGAAVPVMSGAFDPSQYEAQ